MRLTGKAEDILAAIARDVPEVRKALKRIDKTITRKAQREVEEFQAAALYAIAQAHNRDGARFLEIGTAVGYSASVLAFGAPDAHIVTLNPDEGEATAAVKNLEALVLTDQIEVLVVKSAQYLASADEGDRYDLIFIDGDHARVRVDIPVWDLLAVGGVMIFHDYSPAGTRRACPPVYEACQEFAAYLGRADVLIVDDTGTGMIGFVKQSDDPRWVGKADEPDAAMLDAVSRSSIQPVERLVKLWQLARKSANVDGAVVSLGAGEGGAAVLMMDGAGADGRDVWLFDTWEGIPAPGAHDGDKAHAKYAAKKGEWLRFSMDNAAVTLGNAGLVAACLVKGRIEATVADAAQIIGAIAVLHIDVDWYVPTRAALDALYDLVADGGVIICDDYGHWQGTRKAVDEFRSARGITSPIMALDYTAHWWRKDG